MNIKLLFAISILIFLTSCSTYENQRVKKGNEKIYYSASGFALTYDDVLYKDKIINKKMSNNGLFAFHRNLKKIHL